ncbi:hypothetical protein QCD60_13575 [Pokkaliibacter sp. MBI-7]|nr:hypothetical protein [Pokkaliibacter sp. MBI-7]MDH2433596.1 hypothetical protein [Pokkaliibacter sp. MBI-7]
MALNRGRGVAGIQGADWQESKSNSFHSMNGAGDKQGSQRSRCEGVVP